MSSKTQRLSERSRYVAIRLAVVFAIACVVIARRPRARATAVELVAYLLGNKKVSLSYRLSSTR